MLILLQPGIEPLGQFDLEDDDTDLLVGGEVGVFADLDEESDAYAGDVWAPGPRIQIELASDTVPVAAGELHGLLDEGSSGYGTLFGSVIGATVGQGTGFGALSGTGTVVVGPSTVRGSGKATLWTKPGLYGVTVDAWASSATFDALTLNEALYATEGTGDTRGKLTDTGTVQVALGLGLTTDTSLVSTTNTAAGLQAATEYAAVYLLGVQS